MELDIAGVEHMAPEQEAEFWAAFQAELMQDDGSAAREHLAAGFPIYFREADTPAGLLVKEHPDGQRELVRFDPAGDEVVQSAA